MRFCVVRLLSQRQGKTGHLLQFFGFLYEIYRYVRFSPENTPEGLRFLGFPEVLCDKTSRSGKFHTERGLILARAGLSHIALLLSFGGSLVGW